MERYLDLIDLMRSRRNILVAFSGGVDSTLVALAAIEALDGRCTLVMVDNGTLPKGEIDHARRTASALGSPLKVLELPVLDHEDIVSNPDDRCGTCKGYMMSNLIGTAREVGSEVVADGMNVDDRNEYRPGLEVSSRLGIWHPLIETGIGKEEARSILREKGISIHDRPSNTCLMTRIPYGERVTRDKMGMIDHVESQVRGLGFRDVRLRLFERSGGGYIGILEVDEPKRIMPLWNTIQYPLSELLLVLDPAGYRQGSLNVGRISP
ncbi:MAG: ATP-dependent sacrificial sulfur transferase LarE [Candidatus Thermoplasmatota archaeon]|nr:ATP-dependent sacrificial sulfur transferase LarE [Candidatus Thermoplasmatota archaeon]